MSEVDYGKVNRAKDFIIGLSFSEYAKFSQWAKRYEKRTDWSRKK